MTLRSHLFPYRTQQLSSVVPKVVGGSPPARIGRCDAYHSELAQLVEHTTVNRAVVGSSPTFGVIGSHSIVNGFFCTKK